MATVYPDPVNFTGIVGVFNYVNQIGSYWTLPLFIITLHIIFLSYMFRKGNEFFESMLATTYIMIVPVGFLYVMRVVNGKFLSFYIVLISFTILASYMKKRPED